jgi:hypothetical protein
MRVLISRPCKHHELLGRDELHDSLLFTHAAKDTHAQ